MTKKNQTAWDRINEKVEELRDAIIEELESGELVKILDCAWANSFDLEYEMNVTVDASNTQLTIEGKAELEISIELTAGDC